MTRGGSLLVPYEIVDPVSVLFRRLDHKKRKGSNHMQPKEWSPDDIERISSMTGLPPEIHAIYQRDAHEQRNRSHEDLSKFDEGYRAFYDRKEQRENPYPASGSNDAWSRGWQYAQLEDDD